MSLWFSIGVATFHSGHDDNFDYFFNRADEALYRAKKNGRNLVEAAVEPTTPKVSSSAARPALSTGNSCPRTGQPLGVIFTQCQPGVPLEVPYCPAVDHHLYCGPRALPLSPPVYHSTPSGKWWTRSCRHTVSGRSGCGNMGQAWICETAELPEYKRSYRRREGQGISCTSSILQRLPD